MVSVFTPNKRIEQPALNDYVDSWDVPANANWGFIDKALGGSTLLNATGQSGGANVTLTPTQYQAMSLIISGAPGAGGVVYCIPAGVGGQWTVVNNTTGGQTVALRSLSGGAILAVPVGNMLLSCDGTASGIRYSQTINSVLGAGGLTTQVQYNNAGVLAGSANLTFDGTTIKALNLTATGNTQLGDAAADTLSIVGTTATAANGLNINTDQLVLLSGATERVAVGTAVPGVEKFTVQGDVKIAGTTSGLVFQDGTRQVTAALSSGAAGPIRAIQYSLNGTGGFGGEAGFTYDPAINTADIETLRLVNPLGIAYGGTGSTTSTGNGGSGVVLRLNPDLTGVPTAPTAPVGTNTQQIATTAFVTAAVAATSASGTAVLPADVPMGTIGLYYDGVLSFPPVAGTYFVSASTTLRDTAGQGQYSCKLWDGTTVIAGTVVWSQAGQSVQVALSGVIANPTGSLRISVKPLLSASGVQLATLAGESKTSMISWHRLI